MSYLDDNPEEAKNASYYRRQMKKLQRQLEEKTRLLAAYEAQPVVMWYRTDVAKDLVTSNSHIARGWELNSLPHEALISPPPSTAHLDALLAEAERRGMERAAQICEDISKNGRGGAGTCVREIRAAAQN